HHAAASIASRMQRLNPGDSSNRIAKNDRVMEPPFEDAEERNRVHAWCLAHQPARDRHPKESVRHRLAKRTLVRREVYDVEGIENSGEPRKEDDIGGCHRPARALPLIAEDQLVE